MKSTLRIVIVMFVLVFSNEIYAQETTKKELKEARKVEQQKKNRNPCGK